MTDYEISQPDVSRRIESLAEQQEELVRCGAILLKIKELIKEEVSIEDAISKERVAVGELILLEKYIGSIGSLSKKFSGISFLEDGTVLKGEIVLKKGEIKIEKNEPEILKVEAMTKKSEPMESIRLLKKQDSHDDERLDGNARKVGDDGSRDKPDRFFPEVETVHSQQSSVKEKAVKKNGLKKKKGAVESKKRTVESKKPTAKAENDSKSTNSTFEGSSSGGSSALSSKDMIYQPPILDLIWFSKETEGIEVLGVQDLIQRSGDSYAVCSIDGDSDFEFSIAKLIKLSNVFAEESALYMRQLPRFIKSLGKMNTNDAGQIVYDARSFLKETKQHGLGAFTAYCGKTREEREFEKKKARTIRAIRRR